MADVADPTARRKYLADPNYYRLGYQLAAQMVHRGEGEQRRTPGFESHLDILYGDRAPHADHVGPEEEAKRLIDDGEAVLRWFADRRKTRRWVLFRDKPTIREERLERFLRRTVIPCLKIVIAASLRSTYPDRSEEELTTLRNQADAKCREEGEGQDISYRVLYNLACYEAGEGESQKERVLRYLAAAIDRAPSSRRSELRKWAGKDPSFKHFHGDDEFKKLVNSSE